MNSQYFSPGSFALNSRSDLVEWKLNNICTNSPFCRRITCLLPKLIQFPHFNTYYFIISRILILRDRQSEPVRFGVWLATAARLSLLDLWSRLDGRTTSLYVVRINVYSEEISTFWMYYHIHWSFVNICEVTSALTSGLKLPSDLTGGG